MRVPLKRISGLLMSWMSYDSAANSTPVWLLHHATFENFGDRSFQIMLSRLRPFLSKTKIAVIDSPVIYGAKSIAAMLPRNKNRRLRCDLCVSKSHELMIWIK
jgi:hypothetical protein